MASIQAVIGAIDPDVPIFEVATVQEILSRREGPSRFAAQLMVAFAMAALLLAALGVYGVLAFTVTERTREIGVRAALGSSTWTTLRHILSRGMRFPLAGIGLGIVASFGLEPILASVLVGVSTVDYWTIAFATALLVSVWAVASVVPAFRATRIDPVIALRHE